MTIPAAVWRIGDNGRVVEASKCEDVFELQAGHS